MIWHKNYHQSDHKGYDYAEKMAPVSVIMYIIVLLWCFKMLVGFKIA